MPEKTIKKQPVVVVLGHIDAGKTSLLNCLRGVGFTDKKPGGEITQHLGAFEVEKRGQKITFLDTPGHEAFSQMRSRGAKVADIAILVVDAGEGVKEQTKESLLAIQEAKIPFIVALNKIDKTFANPDLAKQQLAKLGVIVESFGGKVPDVLTSAKTGQGIEDLVDLIFLIAEMENLTADISKPASGVIIESWLDPKRGPSASVIVEEGVLRMGEIIGTNSTYGKIKILENFRQERIKEVLPGQMALVLGFENVPKVGEKFFIFESIEKAKENIGKEEKKERKMLLGGEKKEEKVLQIILKTDVLGSKEAIEEILSSLPQEKVGIKILESETGEITEGEVNLAKDFKAIILGFRVKLKKSVKEYAQRMGVKIFLYNVIYELVEGVKKLMVQMLEPEIVRVDLAKMKVLVCFWKKGNRQIVGGRILEGEVRKGAFLEIIRGEEKIGKGKILNLQKEGRDIEVAKKGEEVGILYEGNEKIKEDDLLEIFIEEKRYENLNV